MTEEITAFYQALKDGKLNEARDQISKIYIEKKEEKAALFKDLVLTCITHGDLDRALEACQFAGYKLRNGDLRMCMNAAREKGDLDTYFRCAMHLEQDFTAEEWIEAGFAIEDVTAKLLAIIDKHVPASRLSTKEAIDLYAARLSK